MRHVLKHILCLLVIVLSMVSCDKTPRGVMSVDDMADLIADLQIAEAYIESHRSEFPDDSSKLVLKQSIFKKYGITSEDYDSSLVWYAHNMEDYVKAQDKAIGKLQKRLDKLAKKNGQDGPGDADRGLSGEPTHDAVPRGGAAGPFAGRHGQLTRNDADSDTTDLWQGQRCYLLTQGAGRGFIKFDVTPGSSRQPGDRYELAYKLCRGDNEFKVSLNVDYVDGVTSQIARTTYGDGWVTIDVQSDTTRRVRRIYGYVSYNIKPGHIAYVDSLMLVRTRKSDRNYGFIKTQRLLERHK